MTSLCVYFKYKRTQQIYVTKQVITKAYRVYFIKANEQNDDDYLVDHSTVMYLVGPNGDFLDFFTSSSTTADITKRINEYMAPSVGSDAANVGPLDVMRSSLGAFGKFIRGE